LILQPTKTRRGAAVTHKIRVAHLAQTGSHFFELERLESYKAHEMVCPLLLGCDKLRF
jgi:hypothetical protein